MYEEICCIANEVETPKNAWENNDTDFFRALHSVHK